jgi:hypothetical protein
LWRRSSPSDWRRGRSSARSRIHSRRRLAGQRRLVRHALKHFVIVPAGSPLTYGNVLYIAAIVMLVAVVQLKGVRRLIAVVPTVYVGMCCWEARLTLDPGITAQIMIGAILIVTMAARPQGLLGSRRVEVV